MALFEKIIIVYVDYENNNISGISSSSSSSAIWLQYVILMLLYRQ